MDSPGKQTPDFSFVEISPGEIKPAWLRPVFKDFTRWLGFGLVVVLLGFLNALFVKWSILGRSNALYL